jgi:hypothetical protein
MSVMDLADLTTVFVDPSASVDEERFRGDIQLAGEPSRSATVFIGGLKHLHVTYRVR